MIFFYNIYILYLTQITAETHNQFTFSMVNYKVSFIILSRYKKKKNWAIYDYDNNSFWQNCTYSSYPLQLNYNFL